jgi:hypothetical protein
MSNLFPNREKCETLIDLGRLSELFKSGNITNLENIQTP